MKRLGRTIVLLGCLTLSGGCTSTYAVYKHPVTGDVLECESVGGIASGVIDSVAYAACKTSLEDQGYTRAGTVKRAPSARSASEQSTPRPAPR